MRVHPREQLLFSAALLFIFLFARGASAQAIPEWTEPFPPFHIAGNLYYVGSRGLANYLITPRPRQHPY